MIIELTKEQTAIISFAMGLYTTKLYEQNMTISTDYDKILNRSEQKAFER